ncbi:MAG: hypothetical protein WBA61_03040 [Aequorivita sp.]
MGGSRPCATVADADIKFPTDLNLLNEARDKLGGIIDTLCGGLKVAKPRTYRRVARKKSLNVAKKKRKSGKEIRKGIGGQHSYVKRDLRHIDRIAESDPSALDPLDKKAYRHLLIVKELYRQQNQMYKERTHSIPNRIASIHQPHIRLIVRGKEGKNAEFGAKIYVSLQDGYARINQFGFEAFNEGGLLEGTSRSL